MQSEQTRPTAPPGGDRGDLRHHLARRRAVPGRDHDLRGEVEVADYLDAMGVDIIEAGFPIASEGDFEAVSAISARVKNAVVAEGPRAPPRRTSTAPGEAVRHAQRGRIHVYLDQPRAHEVQAPEVARGRARARHAPGHAARNWVEDVEWSAEDATRTEHDFLCRCVEAAIKAGAGTINIPDTVGYTEAGEYGALIGNAARARAGCRQGRVLGPLPQRPGSGGGELARRRAGGRPPDRVHGERHRRARRQRRARGGRRRCAHAGTCCCSTRASRRRCWRAPQARLGGDELPGAVQQGDRRAERVPRARAASTRTGC